MKNLLSWKQADIILQSLSLIIPVVTGIVGLPGSFVSCYFTVGTAQVISCIINKIFLSRQYKSRGRRPYEIALSLITVLFLLLLYSMEVANSIGGFFGYFALGMLFVGPAMAIFYAGVTIKELNKVEMNKIKNFGNTGQNTESYY